jgi:hypothetical protein
VDGEKEVIRKILWWGVPSVKMKEGFGGWWKWIEEVIERGSVRDELKDVVIRRIKNQKEKKTKNTKQ